MKKIITLVLAIAMLSCLLPVFAVSAAPSISVDGKISDWKNVKSVSIVGSGEADGKSATFYGMLTKDGLYLAVEAKHSRYLTTNGAWWENTNFEVFFGRNNQQAWVSAQGMTAENTTPAKSDNVEKAAMKTTGSEGAYTSVAEMFIPKAKFAENSITDDGSINVGFAWKTLEDRCNNGGNGDMTDWWGPKGAATNFAENGNVCKVYSDGVYLNPISDKKVEFFGRDDVWYYSMGPDTTGGTPVAPANWPTPDVSTMTEGKLPAADFWKPGDNPSDGSQANAYLWLAKEFTVEDPDALKGMGLFSNLNFDDDVNIYINGKLVYSHYQWDGSSQQTILAKDAASLLKKGTNVIAVSLHQHFGGAGVNMSLYAMPTFDPSEAPSVPTTGDSMVYAVVALVATFALGATIICKKRRITE